MYIYIYIYTYIHILANSNEEGTTNTIDRKKDNDA